MDKNSTRSIVEVIKDHMRSFSSRKEIPSKYGKILSDFFQSYLEVLTMHEKKQEDFLPFFATFLDLLDEQLAHPYTFPLYHKRIRHPFDYYQFSLDFFRPLVDFTRSGISGGEHVEQMTDHLVRGENVVLFANHQSEADPMAISFLLEESFPQLIDRLIFVAGTRVISDPLAIPFSMGYNLLCIHSKKHIDNPSSSSNRHARQIHNKRTMEIMVRLFDRGGHAIYVAPSGGRDRRNAQREVEIAPFDPQSVEMFLLMAKRSSRPIRFYTLALSTYRLLPPPEMREVELGETRVTHGGAIHLGFGAEVDMERFPEVDNAKNRREEKRLRAEYLWNLVKRDYESLTH